MQVHFDMEPRTVRANNKVEADRGMIEVERGPLVYCAEWPDNNFDIKEVLVNQNPSFKLGTKTLDAFIPEASKAKLVDWRGQTLTTLTTDAQTLAFDKAGKLTTKDVTLTLIPYYAWAHRGGGDMKVWLAQDLKATNPSQPARQPEQDRVVHAFAVAAEHQRPSGSEGRHRPFDSLHPLVAQEQHHRVDQLHLP